MTLLATIFAGLFCGRVICRSSRAKQSKIKYLGIVAGLLSPDKGSEARDKDE